MIFQTLAFGLVTCLFFLRGPAAFRTPTNIPAWQATGFAILGLLPLGVFVPAQEFDNWMGGSNLSNILQAISATAGFWFLRDALRLQGALDQANRKSIAFIPPMPGKLRFILVNVLGQLGLFVLIPDHTGFPLTFVDTHLHHVATWLYLTLYMCTLTWLAVTSIRSIWRSWRGFCSWFLAGLILISAATSFDLVYLYFGHIYGRLEPIGFLFFRLFEILFYPGMVSILIGYATIAVPRLVQHCRWRIILLKLQLLGVSPVETPAILFQTLLQRNFTLRAEAYKAFIEVNNLIVQGLVAPSTRQNRFLVATEGQFLPSGQHSFYSSPISSEETK